MLVSHLWLRGREFKPRGAARKLGLGRADYWLVGEPFRAPPKKGQLREESILCVPLCEQENLDRHMARLTQDVDDLMTFIADERRKCAELDIWISIGTTVGGQKHYTRSVRFPPDLLAKLAALRIGIEVSAYPSSDETMRRETPWPEGMGR